MFGMRGKGVRRRAGTANLPGLGLAASVSLTACVLAAVPAVASGDAGDLDQAFGLAAHGRVAFDLHGARYIEGVAVQPAHGARLRIRAIILRRLSRRMPCSSLQANSTAEPTWRSRAWPSS